MNKFSPIYYLSSLSSSELEGLGFKLADRKVFRLMMKSVETPDGTFHSLSLSPFISDSSISYDLFIIQCQPKLRVPFSMRFISLNKVYFNIYV